MRPRTSGGRDFQEDLLRQLLEAKQVTTIYLRNRMSLRGRLLHLDPYVLLLEPLDGTPPSMIYKSAIVSISGPRRGGGRRSFGRSGGYPPRPEGDRQAPPRDDPAPASGRPKATEPTSSQG